MADLTVNTAKRTSNGTAVAYESPAGAGAGNPDHFVNDGHTYLYVVNGAVDAVITFITEVTTDGLAVTDLTATVLATTNRIIGPFPTNFYNDVDGKVEIWVDDASNVQYAVIKEG
jgi:hypothetical protein